ncbi:MAG: FGGY-family carbohydrate kinase [bacterium]
MKYAIAVLDVGKTNKKLLIFDDTLTLLDSTYRTFPPKERDGIPVEDLDGLMSWFYTQLKEFAAQYPIRSISCSTHGAAFVGVDENGRQTLPLVDYTYEPGEEFHERFYRTVGDRHELQRTTATLELKALINPSQGLFFSREQFPDEFAATRWFLPFPSFFAMQLTGIPSAEWTYVGCHTYLWDFAKNTWSQVADRLGIRDRLPDHIARPYDRLGTIRPELAAETGLPEDTVVPFCIHDSNAALLPYLVTEQEPFLLNSTGTWCVVMRPAEEVSFADDEIGKSVFFNLSANGTPVKTAILMAGLEFETYTDILRSLHGVDTLPEFDPAVYERVAKEQSAFILPSVVVGSGQFPDSRPRVIEGEKIFTLDDVHSGAAVPSFFHNIETAYAVLNLSIVAQSIVAFGRVGAVEVTNAYTEGGFRNNVDYNALMAAMFPELSMSLTGIPEASAFGAAMTAKTAHDARSVDELAALLSIEKERVAPAEIPGLQEYVNRFLELV